VSSAYEKVGMFGYVVGVSKTLNFLADNPDKRSTDLPDGEPMGEQLEQDTALVDKAIQLLNELEAESHPRSSDSL
jgi:hypothetical protein